MLPYRVVKVTGVYHMKKDTPAIVIMETQGSIVIYHPTPVNLTLAVTAVYVARKMTILSAHALVDTAATRVMTNQVTELC